MTSQPTADAEVPDTGSPSGGEADRLVEISREGLVEVITMMHRPYNRLGPALITSLLDALNSAVASQARCVVIRSGLRHFCVGAEMDALRARMEGGQAATNAVLDVLETFEGLPVPIVASVHGVCVGGGLELALACDLVVAARSAKIGSVESTLGLHPIMGAIQRVTQRAGVQRAKEMAMLGRRYDAETLHSWGLVSRVVADEDLPAATMALASELAHGPTVAHAATKRLARVAADQGVAAADRAMAEIQAPIWASEDLAEGVASFAHSGMPGMYPFQGR